MNLSWRRLHLDVLLLNLLGSVVWTVKLWYLLLASNVGYLMYITFMWCELLMLSRSSTEFLLQLMITKEGVWGNHLSLTLNEVCVWGWKLIKNLLVFPSGCNHFETFRTEDKIESEWLGVVFLLLFVCFAFFLSSHNLMILTYLC